MISHAAPYPSRARLAKDIARSLTSSVCSWSMTSALGGRKGASSLVQVVQRKATAGAAAAGGGDKQEKPLGPYHGCRLYCCCARSRVMFTFARHT